MYASLGIVDVVWKLDLATSVKFKIEFNKKKETNVSVHVLTF